MPQSVYLKKHFKSLCLSVSSFFSFCLIVSLLSMKGFPVDLMMSVLLFLGSMLFISTRRCISSLRLVSLFLLSAHRNNRNMCYYIQSLVECQFSFYYFTFILKLNLLKNLEHSVNYSDIYRL